MMSEGGRPRTYSDEDLLNWVRRLADGDVPPTRCEVESSEGPSYTTYHRRFGSWNAAVEAAGFESRAWRGEYTDEELLGWIDAYVEEFGVPPLGNDLAGWPGPSAYFYRKRFGSVREATRAAGYEPRGGDR